MSEKHKSARYSQSRTDTLIGAGTRIEGNITFTGVLRIDGEIIGDVSCDDDTHGTIVVGKLGCVTGAVKAPHVVVEGRVCGSVHSSESIEILPNARVVGDASYRDIVIHEGGVIEGVLTPRLPTQEDSSGQEHRVQKLAPPPARESAGAPTAAVSDGNVPGKPPGKGRKFGAALALLIAVVAFVWINLSPTAVTPRAASVVAKANNPAPQSPASTPPHVESAVPLAPGPQAVTKDVVQATPPDIPEPDLKHVVVVQGDNPGKPGDFIYVVIGKEPAVMFRKQRKDPAEGTRIGVAQGTSKRIAIAKDDILRVEQGRGLQMFYQGRKVAPTTIESGAWMSFVPNSRRGTPDK